MATPLFVQLGPLLAPLLDPVITSRCARAAASRRRGGGRYGMEGKHEGNHHPVCARLDGTGASAGGVRRGGLSVRLLLCSIRGARAWNF
jgi:hypothetical protein